MEKTTQPLTGTHSDTASQHDQPKFIPVVVEQTFNAPVSKIWKAITDKNQMKEWYFETMDTFKPEVGFETEFNVHANDRDYLHKWRVTEVEPEKRITYIWTFGGYDGEWVVNFELSTENCNTKLTLTALGIESFPPDNPDFSRESCTEGWNHFIRYRLKEFVNKE